MPHQWWRPASMSIEWDYHWDKNIGLLKIEKETFD
jgi:hypothetical protein